MTICPLLLKNQQLWTEITEHRINENRIYKLEWIDKNSVYTMQFVSHSKVKCAKSYDRSNWLWILLARQNQRAVD
jgi:hypothetical protein